MLDVQNALSLLLRDPVLGYSLLAAVFLGSVSLLTGAARRDFMALRHPGVLLRLALGVALAVALTAFNAQLRAVLQPDSDAIWWLDGLQRLPLYALALAYGPSVGLVAALLFAAFEASAALPGFAAAVLALELVVAGWLAIHPSPRRQRLAGPLHVLLAYGLAWGSGGVALLAHRSAEVTLAGFWAQQTSTLGGVLLTALLALALAPAGYRRWFPHSRIAPEPDPAAVPIVPPGSEVGARAGGRDAGLPAMEAPIVLERDGRREERTLDPPVRPPPPRRDDP